MKFKKIISAISAIAMLSTSLMVVNAETEITLVEDGCLVVENMPSSDEVKQRKVSLTYEDVVELADFDAVKAATGTSFAKKTKQNGSYDVYQVTLKLSNIGDLVNGWDDSWDATSYIGVRSINFQLAFGETDFIGYVKDTAQLADGTFKYAWDGSSHNFIYAASENGNPYPAYDSAAEGDAILVEDTPIELTVFFAFPEGTAVTLDADDYYYASVNYQYNCKGDVGLAETLLVTPESYTFGEVVEEPKEMEVTVADKRFDLDINDDTVADGYAWEVLVTNYDSTKTLSAKFTDAETGLPRAGKEKTEITGLAAAAETDGSIEFVALLQLSQARNVNFEIVVE